MTAVNDAELLARAVNIESRDGSKHLDRAAAQRIIDAFEEKQLSATKAMAQFNWHGVVLVHGKYLDHLRSLAEAAEQAALEEIERIAQELEL